tara:strand:+ start:220 stop:381 length:162 start_codon:yes stop_codon:yes gene_type:complete
LAFIGTTIEVITVTVITLVGAILDTISTTGNRALCSTGILIIEVPIIALFSTI